MHVIEVIPLKKGVQIESLSYYSSVPYDLGTILSIPVRKQHIQGIVVAVKPVSTAKTALRTATFSLKKLPTQKGDLKLPASLIKTAAAIQQRTPAHLGAILFSLLPAEVRSGEQTYPQLPEPTEAESMVPSVLTATAHDRYLAYRSWIREAFAHRGSVLFVVPTSAAVEQAKTLLERGIESRVITFSSAQTKKQRAAAYTSFEDLRQAQLIITTPNFAFLCRHDITSMVIENASSQHFVARARPYLDARESLKCYANTIGAELLIGDNVPPTEDEVFRREDRYQTYEEEAQRLQLPSGFKITKHEEDSLQFSILTPELTEQMNVTLANRGRVFLYASRRGLAPIVLCKDCGHIFTCPDSGAPYSLLRTGSGDEEKQWFYSATSGKRVRAADVCPDCNSWRLFEQGIGVQQVHDYVKEHFPKTPLTLIDHTTANTHSKAKKLMTKFFSEKRSILVGTGLALPYLTKQIDCIGVVSYEAMRSVPTWRADESVFQTLLTLREIASKDVFVQTRSESDELLHLAERGLVEKFYDGEISVRQSLNYPPFSTFVLLTFSGTKEQVQTIETTLQKNLTALDAQFYNGPLSTAEKTIRYGLLRLTPNQLASPSLTEQLRSLPPYIKIEVNPSKIV